MRFVVTTADPMPEAVDLPTVGKWVRVGSNDDLTLEFLIRAAMFWAEGFCDQPLFARTYQVALPDFQAYGILPGMNVDTASISFLYDTRTLLDQILPASAYSYSARGVLQFSRSQTAALGAYNVRGTYTAGYDRTAGGIPEDIILALMLVAGNMYDNRANPVSERRTAAESLLQNYRLY